MTQHENEKAPKSDAKAERGEKLYLPYRAKGDIDDFIFEGNCTLRHSEK